jgi:hypothetical protein
MSKKEVSMCDYCKKTVAVVTSSGVNRATFYWCASCYTGYMSRVINRPRVRHS